MNDIIVNDWCSLQKAIFTDTWDENINRFRSPYVYRGLDDKDFGLKTSLMRLGGEYIALEKHLLRNFKKYACKTAIPGNSLWNWLTLAQHHGLPTRLLDWTYSPYIALHFATADINSFNKDGAIWCVNYVKTNKMLPASYKDRLGEEGSNVFTTEMLGGLAPTLAKFDTEQQDDYVVFFEPPSLDEKIVVQHALFSVMSNSAITLDKWLADKEEYCFRIIIPAALKWEIRDKLDQVNITERVLFGGLNGLCRWLKRQYSPKLDF